MKKIIAFLVIQLILAALIFFLAAFINMSLNPRVWGEGGRFFCVIFFIVSIAASLMITLETFDS